MRHEMNEQDMEKVTGGPVRQNTTRMRIGFTEHGEAYDLKGCEDYEAMSLVTEMYAKHKNEGDWAYEEATLAAFRGRGWI